MKNDQYLKLEVSLFNTDLVERLIDRLGMEGWGIYVALLVRMRQDDELTIAGSESSVAAMARRWNTTFERMMEVVSESGLLVPFDEKEDRFTSPYLNRVMAPLWIKRGQKLWSVNKPKARTVNRSADGRFAASASIEEKSREKEEKSYNSSKSIAVDSAAAVAVAVDSVAVDSRVEAVVRLVAAPVSTPVSIRPWQALIDEMTTDRPWMDMVGARSTLGQLYIDHRDEIVEFFRQHIRLYDKGGGLIQPQDVKQYFANYLAAGSRTCQVVRQKLLEHVRQQQASAGVSTYETIVDGQRTYLGRPIPEDAPPRPDEFSVWDEEKERWTR